MAKKKLKDFLSDDVDFTKLPVNYSLLAAKSDNIERNVKKYFSRFISIKSHNTDKVNAYPFYKPVSRVFKQIDDE